MKQKFDNRPVFKRYRPRKGDPDLTTCHEAALELLPKVLPNIRKRTDLSLAYKTRDARRKAEALRRSATNLVVNRRHYRNGDHAFRPLYTIWTTLNDCIFRCRYCDNHQGKSYFYIPDP